MDLGSHATLKDKHEIVLFYKIINGLAPQYMLGLIYSCFATDDHADTYDLMSVGKFTVFHFFALLPYIYMSVGNFYCLPLFALLLIAVALFHLQLNYGIIVMQK